MSPRSSSQGLPPFATGDTLEGTRIHPIWSPARAAWIPMGEWTVGDTVLGRDGEIAVVKIQFHSRSVPVYNLEVHGEHVYEVTAAEILVHNACPDIPAPNTKVVLGLDKHLDDFAAAQQGKKVLQLAKDPVNWKGDFTRLMNDPNTEVIFNLKNVDVWPGVSRAASGKGFGATDWELLQIYQNKDWWSRIKWINELGNEVPNPFK